MTIGKTGNKVQYNGDGGTLPFAYEFRFFDDTDLEVILLDASNVETVQTLTTNYTVSNTGTEAGGTVTMIVAPAVGEKLTIVGAIPETQGTDYTGNDPFPAETHETALDRLTRMAQQTSEISERSLRVTASDTASLEIPFDRASTFLGFDASKNPIAIAGTVTEIPVSTFMATVLDDETAAAARATLGAGTGDGTLDNVADDTMPQLGGALDTNSFPIDESKGADVATATEALVLRDGNSFDFTGTTTVATIEDTADAWPVGSKFRGRAIGIFTFTHSANLQCKTGADITTAAGDTFGWEKYAAGAWRMFDYQRADGSALGGGKWGYESLETTIVKGSPISFTHGLGGRAKNMEFSLICKIAEFNYSVGDEAFGPHPASANQGIAKVIDGDTTVRVLVASIVTVSDKTTFASSNITVANWKLIMRASL